MTNPADILSLPLRAKYDGMILNHRTWSREVSASPAVEAAIASGDLRALDAARGTPESVTFTTDGRDARPGAWCSCRTEADSAEWVRYERWTAEGHVAHGYVCPTITCRRLLQSG